MSLTLTLNLSALGVASCGLWHTISLSLRAPQSAFSTLSTSSGRFNDTPFLFYIFNLAEAQYIGLLYLISGCSPAFGAKDLRRRWTLAFSIAYVYEHGRTREKCKICLRLTRGNAVLKQSAHFTLVSRRSFSGHKVSYEGRSSLRLRSLL